MNFLESIRIALEGIRANKLRSFLTTLGIIIGIAAVIAVVAIGQGGQALLMQEMEKIGTNNFQVYISWRNDEPRTGKEFAMQDVAVIKEMVPEVHHIAPICSSYMPVHGGRVNKSAEITATTSDFANIRNLSLKEGRFFNETDSLGGRKVAVIDEKLAEEFFGRSQALGRKISVQDMPLVVIGIIKQEESIVNNGQLKHVYMPLRTWQSIFPESYIDYIEGRARTKDDVEAAMEKTVKVLERRHHLPERYDRISMKQEMATANKVTGVMTLIIGAIAGISLLVGGIGVMNIMLVSVTERVREIGIRKALGARRKDILWQFLIEAVVLCSIGGIIGMTLGIGGSYLIAKIAKFPPVLSWFTVLVAFLFSATVGIIFGILPANKAAKLDPIQALRRE